MSSLIKISMGLFYAEMVSFCTYCGKMHKMKHWGGVCGFCGAGTGFCVEARIAVWYVRKYFPVLLVARGLPMSAVEWQDGTGLLDCRLQVRTAVPILQCGYETGCIKHKNFWQYETEHENLWNTFALGDIKRFSSWEWTPVNGYQTLTKFL